MLNPVRLSSSVASASTLKIISDSEFQFPFLFPHTVQRNQAFILYLLTTCSVQTHIIYVMLNKTTKYPAIMEFLVYLWKKDHEKAIKVNQCTTAN